MNYCTISHTSKNVSFKDGTKAKEFYYHLKTKNLLVNYKDEFECVKRCVEQIETSRIGACFLDCSTDYYNMNWDTCLGWKNYTLNDLCVDILAEITSTNHPKALGRPYDRFAGSLKRDGLYANFRIYENI